MIDVEVIAEGGKTFWLRIIHERDIIHNKIRGLYVAGKLRVLLKCLIVSSVILIGITCVVL